MQVHLDTDKEPAFAKIIEGWNDLEFKQNFRVSRETFQYLWTVLQSRLQHTSSLREVITVKKSCYSIVEAGNNPQPLELTKGHY